MFISYKIILHFVFYGHEESTKCISYEVHSTGRKSHDLPTDAKGSLNGRSAEQSLLEHRRIQMRHINILLRTFLM